MVESPHRVVIAGGGVAGVEALLALHALTGDRTSIELVAPQPSLIYRPQRVIEPFEAGEVRRFSLDGLAASHGASFRAGGLTSVDPAAREAHLRDGSRLSFDSLIVATGARTGAVLPGMIGFAGPAGTSDLSAALGRAREGGIRDLVFAVPKDAGWPLPLYELALLTAWSLNRDGLRGVRITLVTPEPAPLELFGSEASAQVAALLDGREIDVRAGVAPLRAERGRVLLADGSALAADRSFTMPSLRGPGVIGLATDEKGYIPTDPHARVRGTRDVYAAGDGTGHPVKQGGLATQQADAAAEDIASRLGLVEAPQPFRPVLRAVLLTGEAPLYLRTEEGPGGAEAVSAQALWWPPGKLAGRYLSPFLAGLERPSSAHMRFTERATGNVDVPDGYEAAVRLAFSQADKEGGRGSCGRALEWLDVVEDLQGVLPPEYVAKRRRWRAGVAG